MYNIQNHIKVLYCWYAYVCLFTRVLAVFKYVGLHGRRGGGLYRVAQKKYGTVDTVDFLGLCSDQQLSFSSL